MLRFEFFGIAQLWRDQQTIPLRRAKALALLLYLAINRTKQTRERIITLLWPESSAQAARKNLRNTLWEIGEALGEQAIEQQGSYLQLHPAIAIDIYTLEDGLLLLETGSVAALEACIQVYRGPLADGLVLNEAADFELWLDSERERLAALYQRLLERMIELYAKASNWQAMLDTSHKLIASDPFREQAYLAQIQAHLQLGQRAQAMLLYRQLSDLLERELAVEPLPETQARYQQLLAQTPNLGNNAQHSLVEKTDRGQTQIQSPSSQSQAESPQNLFALLRAQIQNTISPADLQIAQALAVLGQQSEFAAIWASAGRSEQQTIDALDRLQAAGLLSYSNQRYSFVDPMLSSVIYADLSPSRRHFLQQRATLARERQAAPSPAQLQPPDAQATVDLAEQSVAWRTIQQRQLVLAEALMQAGQLQTAQNQLLAVYAVFRQKKDNLGQARAILLLANISVLQHQSDTTRQWLDKLAALDVPDALRAEALLFEAAAYRQAQHFASAEQSLAQAKLLIAEQDSLAGAWWFERGNLFANQGDLPSALAAFEQSLQIAQAIGDLTREAMAHNNLAYHALLAGQFTRAELHVALAEDLVKRYEIGYLWQFVGSTKGEIALELGKLVQAKDAFREAYTAAKAWHNQQQQANIRLSQAQIAKQEGQVEQAEEYVQQAHKLVAEVENPQLTQKFRQFL